MNISREHEPIPMTTEFGPIGEQNYSEAARRLVREGLQDGSVNVDDRKEMWKNFAKLEAAVAERIEKAGGTRVDIIGIFEEEIWKHRQATGSAKEADFQAFRAQRLLEQSQPHAVVKNLDDHHASVEVYAKKLLPKLLKAANDSNKKTPLSADQMLLIVEGMRIHDEFKWIAKFGSKDSIAADHEEQMRYFVRKYFVGQTVADIVITEELAHWLADALGEHENIYDEDNWSKQRAEQDDHAETISFEFLIDTMTNAIDVEKDSSGQWNVTLNPEEFARFTDLAERHLHLFVPGDVNISGNRNFEIAKAYRPEWILKASIDFIKILQSWESNYGVHTSPEVVSTIFAECYGVLEKASLALEGSDKQLMVLQIEQSKQVMRDRQKDLKGAESVNFKMVENKAFYEVVEDTLNTKDALRAIAVGNGKAYADATGRDEKSSVLQPTEIALLQRSKEFSMSPQDHRVEAVGNNSVGFIQLMRLLALMESNPDENVQGLSFAARLDLIAGNTKGLSPTWMEIGARGAHAGWLLSVQVASKERQAKMLAFDNRDQLASSSDWLQIQNAARFLQGKSIGSFDALIALYHDRDAMVDCANACHAGYVKTQVDYYQSIGKNVPTSLTEPLLTSEDVEALKYGSTYGFDGSNPQDQARMKFGENILGFIALQEEIANLAHLRHRQAREILHEIINGTLAPADQSFLISAQKALYLQMQVYKGRYANPGIDVESIQPQLRKDESIEDWRQIKEAAVVMLAQLAEQAQPEAELDLSLEMTEGRPTRIIDQDAGEQELSATLEEMGIQVPDHVFMLSGGAVFMEGGVNLDEFESSIFTQIKAMVERGEKVLIVTGGTDSGFMHIAGKIAARLFNEFPKAKQFVQVLGISPKDLVTFEKNPPDGKYTVATGHTHHLWVNKAAVSGTGARIDLPDTFGDETSIIQRVLALYGQETLGNEFIVGNGGVGTALEVRADLEIGFPLHFIKDSYRMAALVGAVLEANTYEEYKALVTSRMTPVAGEAPDVTKQKQKTQKEIDNIFAILRGSDEGIDTRVSDNLQKVPVATEANYQRVREMLLANRSGVKYVTVAELDQDLAKMKRSVSDLIRERLATKDPDQRDLLEKLWEAAGKRVRAFRN